MSHMTITPEYVAVEVANWYVTPMWVANYYGVSRLRVHRAIAAGKLTAIRVLGEPKSAVILDRRTLPDTFPR